MNKKIRISLLTLKKLLLTLAVMLEFCVKSSEQVIIFQVLLWNFAEFSRSFEAVLKKGVTFLMATVNSPERST